VGEVLEASVGYGEERREELAVGGANSDDGAAPVRGVACTREERPCPFYRQRVPLLRRHDGSARVASTAACGVPPGGRHGGDPTRAAQGATPKGSVRVWPRGAGPRCARPEGPGH
jgi:hypothetical protein